VLADATQLLSGLSRGAGVVLTSKSNVRLKHIEFVRIEPERALVVLVSEDGQVENRIVPIPAGLPPSALVEASNFLNAHIRGRTLAEARAEMQKSLDQARSELDGLTQKLVEAGLASWSGGEPAERKLIVRGQANLLGDLQARWRISSASACSSTISNPSATSSTCSAGPRRRRACASSSARRTSCSRCRAPPWWWRPIGTAERRIVGVLGVIGPTRLNYARIVPMVDYTARVLSRLIT
jgi:heat-inducible transcriptional repressor